MAVEKGKFYLTGLGIVMQGIIFTPEEKHMLNFLCKQAAKGDQYYLAALEVIKADLSATRLLEQVKNTLRSLGKGPELEAYYDREHRVYR